MLGFHYFGNFNTICGSKIWVLSWKLDFNASIKIREIEKYSKIR